MNKRVTFEVDDTKLSDVLSGVSGETGFLGDHMVGALMVEPGSADLTAMAIYGVVYVGSEPVEGDKLGE